MDYRYFYMSNKYYYDELARMSLIMSNAVSNGNSGVDNNQETKDMTYINTAMASIGMKCNYENVIKDNFSKENKFYKYGKNIHASVINNGSLKEKWNKDHKVSYPNTGSEKFSNILIYFKEISNQLEDIFSKKGLCSFMILLNLLKCLSLFPKY